MICHTNLCLCFLPFGDQLSVSTSKASPLQGQSHRFSPDTALKRAEVPTMFALLQCLRHALVHNILPPEYSHINALPVALLTMLYIDPFSSLPLLTALAPCFHPLLCLPKSLKYPLEFMK